MSRRLGQLATYGTALGASLSACALFPDFSGLTGPDDEDAGAEKTDAPDASAAPGADGSALDAATQGETNTTPCTKLPVGDKCGQNADCCSDNCYFGYCEGNGVGDRCAEDSKCNTNNCYFG